jgi:hypothetical protein
MPRLSTAGLDEALARPFGQLSSYSTLELIVDIGAGFRSYYLATASLTFNGVIWQPALRQTAEITANLAADASEAAIEIQNVDTLFGIEFVAIEEFLSGAEARVGEYWKDLDRNAEWHEILLTGLITGLDVNEQSAQLTIIPDLYSGVSVGPFRAIRRLCQAAYKSFECGRPATDPPTCDKTLNGAGGCHGRWGAIEKLARHMGAPFLDNKVFQQII